MKTISLAESILFFKHALIVPWQVKLSIIVCSKTIEVAAVGYFAVRALKNIESFDYNLPCNTSPWQA